MRDQILWALVVSLALCGCARKRAPDVVPTPPVKVERHEDVRPTTPDEIEGSEVDSWNRVIRDNLTRIENDLRRLAQLGNADPKSAELRRSIDSGWDSIREARSRLAELGHPLPGMEVDIEYDRVVLRSSGNAPLHIRSVAVVGDAPIHVELLDLLDNCSGKTLQLGEDCGVEGLDLSRLQALDATLYIVQDGPQELGVLSFGGRPTVVPSDSLPPVSEVAPGPEPVTPDSEPKPKPRPKPKPKPEGAEVSLNAVIREKLTQIDDDLNRLAELGNADPSAAGLRRSIDAAWDSISRARSQLAELGHPPPGMELELEGSGDELSAVVSATVRNSGDTPLHIQSIAVVGDGPDIALLDLDDGCSGEILEPLEECVIKATFDPSKPQARSAKLYINHDGTPERPVSLAMYIRKHESHGGTIILAALGAALLAMIVVAAVFVASPSAFQFKVFNTTLAAGAALVVAAVVRATGLHEDAVKLANGHRLASFVTQGGSALATFFMVYLGTPLQRLGMGGDAPTPAPAASPDSTPAAASTPVAEVRAVARSIFISYRRAETADVTGRIYEHLVKRYGAEAVFKDVDDIALGDDFRQTLATALRECRVVLAVMGPEWAAQTDSEGRRRLDDPRDFVRLEVGSALGRNLPLIPLLVRGASIPAPEELPEPLSGLAYRNGMPVRPDPDFANDMRRLIVDIDKILAS